MLRLWESWQLILPLLSPSYPAAKFLGVWGASFPIRTLNQAGVCGWSGAEARGFSPTRPSIESRALSPAKPCTVQPCTLALKSPGMPSWGPCTGSGISCWVGLGVLSQGCQSASTLSIRCGPWLWSQQAVPASVCSWAVQSQTCCMGSDPFYHIGVGPDMQPQNAGSVCGLPLIWRPGPRLSSLVSAT